MIPPDSDLPLLVFGGPYSNREATDAVLSLAASKGIPPGNVICTGDVVAYAGDPEATARLVKASGCHVVAGNCEEQLANAAADCGCGFEEGSACDVLSRRWFAFADKELTSDMRDWMGALPTTLRFTYAARQFAVVHATAASNNQFLFASQTSAVEGAFAACEADIVLAGHSGLPFVHRIDTARAWVNAGVIGVPANDATPDGWYALVVPDGASLRISLERLKYDYRSAASQIRSHGHAEPYADAIETGLWPSLDVLPDTERAQSGERLAEVSIELGHAAPNRASGTDLPLTANPANQSRWYG